MYGKHYDPKKEEHHSEPKTAPGITPGLTPPPMNVSPATFFLTIPPSAIVDDKKKK